MSHPTLTELTRCINPNAATVYILYQQSYSDRIGYSIAVSDAYDHHSFAEDLTDDRDAAERFLALLAEEAAEPCHLSDLVEDALPLR